MEGADVFDIAAKMKAMMSNLTDSELQILESYNGLCRRGYSEPEIELMMGKATYASLSDIAVKMKTPKAEEPSQEEKPAKRKRRAQSVVIDHAYLYTPRKNPRYLESENE